MMKVLTWLLMIVMVLAFGPVLASTVSDQPIRPTPLVRAIDPPRARPGDQLVATGDNLGRDCVAEVHLTQGQKSFKVEIKAQAAGSITLVVPVSVEAGRFGLMVVTSGPEPALLDEPVNVVI